MQEDYGFVYIWRDRKHKRYYIGAHWGRIDDGYICSSPWMLQAYRKRPEDFRRRILNDNISHKSDMFLQERKWFELIKDEEVGKRYYNLSIKQGLHWSTSSNAKEIAIRSGLKRRGAKLGPRPQEVRDKISSTKKERGPTKAQIEAAKVNILTAQANSSNPEAQQKRSDSLKLAYAEGRRTKRPKKEKRPLYAPGERQKQLWADPEWAANQRAKLKIARNNRKE